MDARNGMPFGVTVIGSHPYAAGMAYVELTCPNCSLRTVFNTDRMQCYCINCGFVLRRDDVDLSDPGVSEPVVEGEGLTDCEHDDGMVSVLVTVTGKGQPFAVSFDGEESLRVTGGTHRVRVSPGKHRVDVRHSIYTDGLEAEFAEGTRMSISVGIMGLRTRVEMRGSGSSSDGGGCPQF